MKLVCDTLLFNQLDLYGALQHIAWAGYDGAEICVQESECQHLELNPTKSYIDDVKHMAKKHKLKLSAIATGWGPGFGNQLEEDKIKFVTKVFDVAIKLSIPIISIRTYGKSDDKEATKQQFKYVRKLSERAESRGIMLAVKAHENSSVHDIATTIQMLDEIDSPALGVNLDILPLYKVGVDPSEAVVKFGKKIVHTHFHDGLKALQSKALDPFVPRETGEEQIPGRSDIDFPKILRRLKDVGYDKAIAVYVPAEKPYTLSRQMGIASEARGYLHRCLQELK